MLILVTDGIPTDRPDAHAEAKIVKRRGIRIVGVGVTSGVSDDSCAFVLFLLTRYRQCDNDSRR